MNYDYRKLKGKIKENMRRKRSSQGSMHWRINVKLKTQQ